MRKSTARVKGLGYVVWHTRHELYHVLLGLGWAWVLERSWHHFSLTAVLFSVFSAILPDIDHLVFFFGYGKKDPYTQQVVLLLRGREWRTLISFMEKGHKYNNQLSTHNVYIISLLLLFCIIAVTSHQFYASIFLGAALSHYLFDIADDIFTLGRLNPNWTRWGRGKRKARIRTTSN